MKQNIIAKLTSKDDKSACAFADKIIYAQWDDENRFDSVISVFLAHFTDEKPITARQCIKVLAQVGQAKPQYIPMILSALRDADLSKYKDSMRPLIEKDIADIYTALGETGARQQESSGRIGCGVSVSCWAGNDVRKVMELPDSGGPEC